MPARLHLLSLACLSCLAHASEQSALHPKGRDAGYIADITWVLFTGGGLIFLIVLVAAGIALFGKQAQRDWVGQRAVIVVGGVVFPVIVLSALLVYTFSSGAVSAQPGQPAARVEVIGELWWWRVRYLDERGQLLLETANEIRIPADRPVEILLKSSEVIHSFWVPNLAGKLDLIPGHTNRLRLHADAPGTFRGQCAEYCGAQHAKMAFYVIAESQQAYDAWLENQRRAAAEPKDELLRLGRQLFLDNRCGQCHTVRGTPATGTLGPDLTHVGSRHSLAAGILPNTQGAMAGWIAGSQTIKPGNRMPSFHQFSGHELRALAAYLAGLQ